jgi:hypothetical protein
LPKTGFPANTPVFKITGGTSADVTTIERWWGHNNGSDSLNGGVWIDDDSPRTLYLRDVSLGGGDNYGVFTHPGAGKLFMDDLVSGGGVHLDHSGPVWARQYDIETTRPVGTINDATKLWIFGAKSEQDFTFLSTTDGGSSEVLGACLKPGNLTGSNPVSHVGFINNESNQSLIYTVSGVTNKDFATHVQETRGGVAKQLLHADVNQTTQAGVTRAYMGLFTGYPDPNQSIPIVNLTTAKFQWAWTAAPGVTANTFRIKCGTATGVYTLTKDTGDVTTKTYPVASIIVTPGTYFCAGFAADTVAGLESVASPEASFQATIPTPQPNPPTDFTVINQ